MSVSWNSLPILPLRCILEHLSLEDALAALSTCRHWRSAVFLYQAHKDTLKLEAKYLEKSLFLTRIFKKYTRNLYIYIYCGQEEFDKFMTVIMPQFFDAVKLQQIIFIGPGYIHQSPHMPVVKLKRIILESLVLKHLHCLQKLALMGCEMDSMKNENDRYIHKNIEYYSRPLTFNEVPSPTDSIFYRWNISMLMYSTLQHIIIDYDYANTESIETLSSLTNLTQLSLNICHKHNSTMRPLDWHRLRTRCANLPNVAVNIIGNQEVSAKKFNEIMQNILVEDLPLTSLKILLCKTFYVPLIKHVASVYSTTLRELVWADCPHESSDTTHRVIRQTKRTHAELHNVNPLILLCWQCHRLRRLVIHGYWVWQYDVLGFVRLRKSLEHLEVSSLYAKPGQLMGTLQPNGSHLVRVMASDSQRAVSVEYVNKVNEHTESEWKPISWNELHQGLRARATSENRARYVAWEAVQVLPAALY